MIRCPLTIAKVAPEVKKKLNLQCHPNTLLTKSLNQADLGFNKVNRDLLVYQPGGAGGRFVDVNMFAAIGPGGKLFLKRFPKPAELGPRHYKYAVERLKANPEETRGRVLR